MHVDYFVLGNVRQTGSTASSRDIAPLNNAQVRIGWVIDGRCGDPSCCHGCYAPSIRLCRETRVSPSRALPSTGTDLTIHQPFTLAGCLLLHHLSSWIDGFHDILLRNRRRAERTSIVNYWCALDDGCHISSSSSCQTEGREERRKSIEEQSSLTWAG